MGRRLDIEFDDYLVVPVCPIDSLLDILALEYSYINWLSVLLSRQRHA